jgi:hypothetical protein
MARTAKTTPADELKALKVIKRRLRTVKNAAVSAFVDELISEFDGYASFVTWNPLAPEFREYNKNTKAIIDRLAERVKDVLVDEINEIEDELKTDIETLKFDDVVYRKYGDAPAYVRSK